MVCYAPLEYEEILSHATARTNLEGIMLHEISLSQKDNTVWHRVINITETERRMMAARGKGKGNGGLMFHEHRVPAVQNDQSDRMNGVVT